jgi:hypothetical protein
MDQRDKKKRQKWEQPAKMAGGSALELSIGRVRVLLSRSSAIAEITAISGGLQRTFAAAAAAAAAAAPTFACATHTHTHIQNTHHARTTSA